MLGRLHAVFHLLVELCMGDLLSAGIGGVHLVEILCEPHRCLAVAGAAVPGQGMTGHDGGQVGIDLFGILWAILRIHLRLSGKVVFESG